MNDKIVLAAIAIAMQLPVDASHVMKVAKEYSVDHRAVMSAVNEMLMQRLLLRVIWH